MAGITGFGAYVPIFRLNRDAIAQAWGRGSLKGERSVANNDEDTATMAVEAVVDCLGGVDRDSVDGLFFASTTSPYREKQTASLLATVADLKEEVFTADFSNSLRAGTNALRMAHAAVRSGSARNVLVAAADTRLSHPRSDSDAMPERTGRDFHSPAFGRVRVTLQAAIQFAEICQLFHREKTAVSQGCI